MSISRRQVMLGAAAAATIAVVPSLLVQEASAKAPSEALPEWRKLLIPDPYGPDALRIAEENCYTTVYEEMVLFDHEKGIEAARIPPSSDFYRQILHDYPETMGEHGIPPHIQFGGAVVSGKGDPTFHARWVERTKAKLASGELA